MVDLAMAEHDELVRKSVGTPRRLSVFERIRRLNESLSGLGIKPSADDHPVRRSVGRPRHRRG
jgi:hypothetical protein